MFALRAQRLLADDVKFVGKARRREALSQTWRARVLCLFQRDVAGFQAAVGDEGLRQIVFAHHFARTASSKAV